MPRRSSSRSSGRSSSGGLFGRSQSRSSSSAAPAPTRTAAKPMPQSAPVPAKATPQAMAPAQQSAPSSGGGLMSGLASTVMQGMAFGTGSAIAHRAVDAVAGPRTVVHEHKDVESSHEQPMNLAPASSMQSGSMSRNAMDMGMCSNENEKFSQCLRDNNNNVNACKFYFDMLSQCQREM